jgi:hypothetical protein
MDEVPGSPRLTRAPVSLRDLKTVFDAARDGLNVTLNDGSLTGTGAQAGPGGISIGGASDIRGFYAIITDAIGNGLYTANVVDDAGSSASLPEPNYVTWEGLLQGVLVGEVNNDPNVLAGTIVWLYPSTSETIG